METMDNYASNIYYFRRICRIGGTEQFLYEMAKKYHKYDLLILYDEADLDQLIRLRKLVRCERRKRDVKYRAKKAFYNFNIEAISQIEADEHIFVCHAIYQELGYKPPIDHPKITKIVAVSKYAKSQIEKQQQVQNVHKPVVTCYNPLTIEPKGRFIRVVSASRLDDKTKGGKRTIELINALDRHCKTHQDAHYLWTIFTNNVDYAIKSPNVAIMRPRVDVRPYIADSDWLVQVSNNMETYCYSINEALEYGTRIVRTPLSVAKELKIPEQAELVLDWDCGNVDEVAARMFDQFEDFEYKAPRDGWSRILEKDKSNYKYEEKPVKIKALKSYYDMELKQNVSNWTPAWETSVERARELRDKGLIRVLE